MQVILLKDIKNLGKFGTVRNVADGYALNFLIPQKLAGVATKEKLEELQAKAKRAEKERRDRAGQEQDLAVRLHGWRLEIRAKASENGKLFAGLGEAEIAKEIFSQRRINVPAKNINITKHIKELGEHPVIINCGHGFKAEIIIKVIPWA